MLWVPIRCHTMCRAPAICSRPYGHVARPSGAQESSKTPGALRTPFTGGNELEHWAQRVVVPAASK